MEGFGVVARQQNEGLVERVGVAGVRERQMRQVVHVLLRFVCAFLMSVLAPSSPSLPHGVEWLPTGTHDPFTVVTDPHTLRRFLKLEILQQLDAVCPLGVLLQTSLSLARQPFRQRAGSR